MTYIKEMLNYIHGEPIKNYVPYANVINKAIRLLYDYNQKIEAHLDENIEHPLQEIMAMLQLAYDAHKNKQNVRSKMHKPSDFPYKYTKFIDSAPSLLTSFIKHFKEKILSEYFPNFNSIALQETLVAINRDFQEKKDLEKASHSFQTLEMKLINVGMQVQNFRNEFTKHKDYQENNITSILEEINSSHLNEEDKSVCRRNLTVIKKNYDDYLVYLIKVQKQMLQQYNHIKDLQNQTKAIDASKKR